MDPTANPDRHWFLHTPECNKKWKEYSECHKEYPFLSYLIDVCGGKQRAVVECFQEERREKARQNHKEADKLHAKNIRKLVKAELEKDAELRQ